MNFTVRKYNRIQQYLIKTQHFSIFVELDFKFIAVFRFIQTTFLHFESCHKLNVIIA